MFETGTASDYRDLLERLHTFLTATGSAFGLTYSGVGDGPMGYYKGGSASVAEVFTITALNSTTFSVVGSVTGALANATVGTPYSTNYVAFTIYAGPTQGFVAGDVFTLNTAPKWTLRRRIRGALVTASGGNSGQYGCDNVIDGKAAWDSYRYWSAGAAPKTLQFDFPEALTVAEYAIMGSSVAGYSPRTWTFEYWNGSAWVTLDTRTDVTSWGSSEVKVFAIASPVSASSVRLNITVGNNSTYLQVGAVQLRTAVGGVDQAMSQYIWEGPGNDGNSAVLLGAHAFQRLDVDYYDWELCAFTGFSAALPFYSQPGYHGRLWLPLLNSSIPYWFIVDGRHVKVVAKVGTQYETAYLGFLEPYFTPQQAPYPIALGGSLALGSTQPYWDDVAFRYSNSGNQHRAFTHSDGNVGNSLYYAEARARRLDGTWVPFFASHQDSFTNPSASEGWIWPLSQGMSNVDVCIDGSYALFPAVLSDSTPNHWGQFSGVALLTGQGLSAETLIRIGAVDWLAVPNVTRTDRNDFLAVRLD